MINFAPARTPGRIPDRFLGLRPEDAATIPLLTVAAVVDAATVAVDVVPRHAAATGA